MTTFRFGLLTARVLADGLVGWADPTVAPVPPGSQPPTVEIPLGLFDPEWDRGPDHPIGATVWAHRPDLVPARRG